MKPLVNNQTQLLFANKIGRLAEKFKYRCDVFLAGDGVEELEVDDAELLQLVHQLYHVPLRQADARLRLLRELELPLQLQQFGVHRFEIHPPTHLLLNQSKEKGETNWDRKTI